MIVASHKGRIVKTNGNECWGFASAVDAVVCDVLQDKMAERTGVIRSSKLK